MNNNWKYQVSSPLRAFEWTFLNDDAARGYVISENFIPPLRPPLAFSHLLHWKSTSSLRFLSKPEKENCVESQPSFIVVVLMCSRGTLSLSHTHSVNSH